MHSFRRYIAMLVVTAIMLPNVSFAQAGNIDSLLAQLKALQAQIFELQKKKEDIEKQGKELMEQTRELKKDAREQAAELRRTLREGNEGEDVRVLQALLAADPDIYPEAIISGFFGKKTAQAVKRFQRKYGLAQVGHVGPMTLKQLQRLLGDHPLMVVNNGTGATASSTQLCTFIPPGHLIAPGWKNNKDKKNKHDDDDHQDQGRDNGDFDSLIPFCKTIPPGIFNQLFPGGVPTTTPPVTDATAPIISSIASTNVTASGATITWSTNEGATRQVEYGTSTAYGSMSPLNTTLSTGHTVILSSLTSNTTYHFRVLSKDVQGNLATSGNMTFTTAAVDASAPILSSITSSNITPTGATITWTTNEGATTQVDYGTSASYGSSSTLDSTFSTGHTVVLTGLLNSTTYHFRVNSKDASNNLSISGDLTFTTTAPADMTAPIISGTAVSAIGSTTATIMWNTDEAATGKVYFGVVDPLVLGSASVVENASLVTGHSFGLTGLTASSTYYYVVESKDAANNTATSSQVSFMTVQ